MKTDPTRALGVLAACALAVAGLVGLGSQASAAPAPWDWRVVDAPFEIAAGEFGYREATCPAGFRASTGGLAPNGRGFARRTEESPADEATAGRIGLEKTGGLSAGLKIDAVCVKIADPPPLAFVHDTYGMDDGNDSDAGFHCPGDQAVVTGAARWSNIFDSWAHPAAWAELATTSVSTTVSRVSTVCLSVRAKDNAGNHSPWSSDWCTTPLLDHRAPATSSGWTRDTGSAYWKGTHAQTNLQGMTPQAHRRQGGAHRRTRGWQELTWGATRELELTPWRQ